MKPVIASRTLVWAVIVGVVTGVLNTLVFIDVGSHVHSFIRHLYPDADWIQTPLPGVIFGLGSLLYFNWITHRRGNIFKNLIWIVGNGASFYIAILGGLFLTGQLDALVQNTQLSLFGSGFTIAFIMGGFIGAAIGALFFSLAIEKIRFVFMARVAGIGAVVAGIICFGFSMFGVAPVSGGIDSSMTQSTLFWSTLFLVWQTIMLFNFRYLLKSAA